jgi:hypothetical protein
MPAPVYYDIGSADITSKLYNGQMGFKIPFGTLGTDWNVLRFGFLCQLTNTGASWVNPGPQLLFGATSGATNWWGDATCANFIGGGTRSVMSHANGPPVRFTCGVSQTLGFRKVGTTVTAGTAWGTNPVTYASPGYWSIWGVQITKGSPNFTAKGFANVSTSTNNTREQLTYMLETATLTAIGSTITLAADSAQAIDEGANGAMDHVMIFWDQKSIPFYVSTVGISKIS